jgi:hypothetical protein
MLVDAAREMGWKAEVVDDTRKEYQLGSVHETKVYNSSQVKLKGMIRQKFGITFWKNRPTNERVLLYTPQIPWLNYVSKREVDRYLQALSQRVQAYQPAEASP